MDDTIYVCCCLNKRYELYAVNSIQSLIDNNINEVQYYIYVIHDGSIDIETFINRLQLTDDVILDFIMFDKKYDFYCDSYIQKLSNQLHVILDSDNKLSEIKEHASSIIEYFDIIETNLGSISTTIGEINEL